MMNIKLVVILMAILFTKESSQCDHGEVRVVPVSQTLNQGRVEICIDSNWGTVCSDGWDNDDTAVVCYQLGYGRDDALSLWISSNGSVLIDEVDCDSSEERLADCRYRLRSGDNLNCNYAAVRCSGERLRVQNVNISAATVNITIHTVMISWELYSGAPHEPSSLRIACYNQQRALEFSLLVYNETFTRVSVGGVLSSVSYACCVSVTYYYRGYYYEAERKCASTDSNMLLPDSYITSAPNQISAQSVTTPSSTQMMPASIGSEKVDLNMRASIVGGVLGSIIIILLLLLAMCGGALIFLLRSRSTPPKISSAEMAINRNVSYETTENLMVVNRNISYETIADPSPSSRQQLLPSERNRVSATSLSENYVIQYLEPHQATGGGGEKGEAQHEDYLQLQH